MYWEKNGVNKLILLINFKDNHPVPSACAFDRNEIQQGVQPSKVSEIDRKCL